MSYFKKNIVSIFNMLKKIEKEKKKKRRLTVILGERGQKESEEREYVIIEDKLQG